MWKEDRGVSNPVSLWFTGQGNHKDTMIGENVHRHSKDTKTKVGLDEHRVLSCQDCLNISGAVLGFQQHPKWAGVSVACRCRPPQWLCTACVALLPSSNKKNCDVVVSKPAPHTHPDVGIQPTSCTGRNRKCVKRSLSPAMALLCQCKISLNLTQCSLLRITIATPTQHAFLTSLLLQSLAQIHQ